MENPTPAATEATPAAATEATPSKPETKADRTANAVASLKAMLEAKRAPASPASEPTKTPEPTAATAEKTAAKIEAAGGTAAAQKEGESDAQYELRLAKQYRELRQEKEGRAKAEKAVGEVSKKAAELEKLFEEGKKNPLVMLEKLGWDFAKVVEEINKDSIKAPEKLSPEMREIKDRLDALNRAEKEREDQRLAAERDSARAGHVTQVDAFVKENAEDFPLSAALPGTASAIVAEAYEKGVTDVIPLLKDFEANLEREMLPFMGSEAAIKRLVKAKPELKELFVKALGLEAPAPVAEEPKSIDSIPTAPGTPGAKKSKAQLRDEAVAGLKQARQQGRL